MYKCNCGSVNSFRNFHELHFFTDHLMSVFAVHFLMIFSQTERSKKHHTYIFPFLQEGCIVCPTTDSTFDLRTGAIKEWYPKNPVLRVLTPALRTLFVYPVKTDEENIYISMRGGVKSDASAEIVFSGKAQPGVTATDVNVDEVPTQHYFILADYNLMDFVQ